jgi:AcrR family transcriptional regulator
MDRRERKTQESIKEALVFLIIQNGFENLTIGEVMAKADLNRSTFYLHYSSLSEVLYSIEDSLIAELFALTQKKKQPLRSLLLDVAGFAQREEKPLKAIFKSSSSHFSWKVETVFTPVIAASPFHEGKAGSRGFDYVASFIIQGGIGVFRKWIESGCSLPSDELLKSFEDFFKIDL